MFHYLYGTLIAVTALLHVRDIHYLRLLLTIYVIQSFEHFNGTTFVNYRRETPRN